MIFGESVEYMCNEGFKFKDQTENIMTVSCHWSEEDWDVVYSHLPPCLPKSCEAIVQLEHRNFLYPKLKTSSDLAYADRVEIVCDIG